MTTPLNINAAGLTDVGLVRDENQDCIQLNPELGLYIVLDGMGGHLGGATAARIGREVMVDVVRTGFGTTDPAELLTRACKAAGAEVHRQSRENHELRGMGTTVVAIMMPAPDIAIVAHVGDSRAYLLRGGRLATLTNDHTIVAELVAEGRISPEQAIDHPHASVLSRNLGGTAKTDVELSIVQLQAGDRLMMCSDGLNGFAGHGAIEHVLGGASQAEAASRDLVDLAKRGGGGDNVSVVVIEVGAQNPGPRANLLHGTGPRAWWQRRGLFIDICGRLGLATSPLANGLAPAEALEILAGSFFEAVYHDLENTTGVNVWTYADSLVKAWFAQGGRYQGVQELLDILRAAAMGVVRDVSSTDQDFGVCLEIALLRSLIVTEMVVGGEIGAHLRSISEEQVAAEPATELPEATFASLATLPFVGEQFPVPTQPEVGQCLADALDGATLNAPHQSPYREEILRLIIQACHAAASDFSGEGDLTSVAREIYGNRLLSEQELGPILEVANSARLLHLAAIDRQDIMPEARATAYRFAARAHQAFSHGLALVAVDAGKPSTDRLLEMQQTTSQMRERLARNDRHLSKLEVSLETMEDTVR